MRIYILSLVFLTVSLLTGSAQSTTKQVVSRAEQRKQLLEYLMKMAEAQGQKLDTASISDDMLFGLEDKMKPDLNDLGKYSYDIREQGRNARRKAVNALNKFSRITGKVITEDDLFDSKDERDREDNDMVRGQTIFNEKFYEEMRNQLLSQGMDSAEAENIIAIQRQANGELQEGVLDIDTLGVYIETPKRFVQIRANEQSGSMSSGLMIPGQGTQYYNVYFKDATSEHHVKGTVHLKLFFTNDKKQMSEEDKDFNGQYSVNDFVVRKMNHNKYGDRMLATSKAIILGKYKSLLQENSKSVNVRVVKNRDNVYDMYIDAAPGEYCLVRKNKMMNDYDMVVYDFTIE